MTYTYLGKNQTTSGILYKVSVHVYRDCKNDGTQNQVPFDKEILLCINYKSNGSNYGSLNISLKSEKLIYVDNYCKYKANGCHREAIYEGEIGLPENKRGYDLTWERCCRTNMTSLQNDHRNLPYQGFGV